MACVLALIIRSLFFVDALVYTFSALQVATHITFNPFRRKNAISQYRANMMKKRAEKGHVTLGAF
jgi:hypothetical protein